MVLVLEASDVCEPFSSPSRKGLCCIIVFGFNVLSINFRLRNQLQIWRVSCILIEFV
ncbi:hypothetical protein LguiA_012846 [Lonicera macranthoides]